LLAEATNEDEGGAPIAEKYHALRGCVSNTSLFIALVYRLLNSMDIPVVDVAHDEADGQLAALATQRDGVALSFDSDLLANGVEALLRVKGGGGWGKVMPLNSLFNQRLHTYLQATASRPLSFTLRWRLIATTVERQAVLQVLATRPHASYSNLGMADTSGVCGLFP
jgi:hypothetical protein